MNQFLIVSAVVASYLCFVQGQSSCNLPGGGRGNCISLYNCNSLLAIINKPVKTPQDVNVLRQSQCGFQGQTPKVCCPQTQNDTPKPATDTACFTPDAQQGTCVGLYSCPTLAELLNKPPVAKETIAFVQNSRCEGPEQYSVCCGPKPNINNNNQNSVCKPSVAPPDYNSGCCGTESLSSDRIVGGNATFIDQYPWLVIIEYVKDNSIKLLCGGALISGRYVLTAGHCVVGPVLDHGTPRHVRLGEYDTSNDVQTPDCVIVSGGGEDCTTGVTVIPIEKITAHPDYNPSHRLRRHDIALLRLRQLAPYTDFIRPICLPRVDYTANPPPNFILYVAGWGAINETHSKSNIKLHVDVPFRSKDQCQPAYSVPRRNVALWAGQLCAGGEPDKDSCKGDSGGPLMYENGKTFELIGIVSFGPTPCGMENIPGVYTKVYEYIPWIRSNIKP